MAGAGTLLPFACGSSNSSFCHEADVERSPDPFSQNERNWAVSRPATLGGDAGKRMGRAANSYAVRAKTIIAIGLKQSERRGLFEQSNRF